MLNVRQSGVLCPLSALPGADYCGDLGAGARRFVDWLARHGVRVWQLLPLHPTDAAFGNSPYSAQSVFAGDERYISFAELGNLAAEAGSGERVDYPAALEQRKLAIDHVWQSLSGQLQAEFLFWRKQNKWVETYAAWRALADEQGGIAWTNWPAELRDAGDAIEETATNRKAVIDRIAFGQFLFARQWTALRAYAQARGVALMGDLPIYPHLDSADVWGNRAVFKLDATGHPTSVAGVPPDYFSEDGQLWGNPVYDWGYLRQNSFYWWRERLRHACAQYSQVRIDHFIGLVRAYEVAAGASDARAGEYAEVPTEALLQTLATALPGLPLIAEDLGAEHAGVALALARWQLPGMRVLQFGFGGDPSNPHLPHNFPRNAVAYSGTHDNDTSAGWWQTAGEEERRYFQAYCGLAGEARVDAADAMLRLLLASPALLAVAPVQDVLKLGADARINTPGTTTGNWVWRIRAEDLYKEAPWADFGEMVRVYGRR